MMTKHMTETVTTITKAALRESVLQQCVGLIARMGPITTKQIWEHATENRWALPWSDSTKAWAGYCALFHQLLQPLNTVSIRNTTEGWMLEGACDSATKAATQNRRINSGVGRIIKADLDVQATGTDALLQDDLRAAAMMIRELFEDPAD